MIRGCCGVALLGWFAVPQLNSTNLRAFRYSSFTVCVILYTISS